MAKTTRGKPKVRSATSKPANPKSATAKRTVRKKIRSSGPRSRRSIDNSPESPEDIASDAKSRRGAPHEFLNRETAWLEFNSRVLHEAVDRRTPLLERVRFMGIYTSNLDEFFMKRVGGLKHQVEVGSTRRAGGMTALEQLEAIRKMVLQQQKRQAESYNRSLRPELAKNGVHLLSWHELTSGERAFATKYFRQNLFPVLTPLAVDPGLPFPFISSLSVSFGVTLRHPDRDEKLFARIKIPKIFPQWVSLKPAPARFVSLLEVIHYNLKDLFPDMEILDVMPFRITRNAEVEREEEDAEDLLEMIAEELKQRRFGEVVRLEHGPDPDPWMLRFLMDELELSEDDVYELHGSLDYTDLRPLLDLPLPDLKYDVWTPLVPPRLMDEHASIFDLIREEDLLVHHPYESFTVSVERFVRQAVEDPSVLAVKMTLYRTGDDSPFIPLLIRAAEQGKQVVVLVELKARFDEARNIHWAQELENSGVHVVYGVVGLKTHAKTALVIRQEAQGVQCYVHLGTGNYHKQTAKLYTDVGYFTAKPEYTEDVVELFHYLTGRSLKRTYHKLLVAPAEMKDGILARIRREIDFAKAGKPARIIAKCNSLEERDLVRAFYEASQAGVEIDLIVRGFCCLRPKVKNMSERIRVISVIGRFLEHSRILFFANGSANPLDGEFMIGSADLMYRNLLGRIETMSPIDSRSARERLLEMLDVMLADRRSSWEMQSDGTYVQAQPRTAAEQEGTHRRLMAATRTRHLDELKKMQERIAEANPLELHGHSTTGGSHGGSTSGMGSST
jgi:polyphosphate kinase